MAGRGRLGAWGLIIILASVDGFAGGREMGVEALGLVTGKDSVWVNNQAALPRMAVFGGDVVQTGKGSSAVVNFRSGSTAALAENSEVAVGWNPSPTGLNLRQGAMVVRSSSSQSTRVSVLGAAVTVQGESGFPAICRIAAVGRSVAVFNDGGHVEIQGAGGTLILPKGKFVQLEAGRPQGAGQMAGKVTAAIPEETVLHAGQTKEVTLKIQDAVNWEDLVKTLKAGRVRIELLDGSALNVGARSTMRITKHDPQSQQTSVEMTVGRLRGEVVKLTKPGANFEVKTQTAVIGVVGTVFLILARTSSTSIWCIQGTLRVSSISAAIGGTVALNAGELTTVPRGGPPTGAVHFSPSQVQPQINQTAVAGPGVTAPGVPTTAVSNVASNAVHAGTAAAGVTTATTSGVAIGRAADARTLLQTTTTTLTQSQSETAAATSAANAVTTTTTQDATLTQTLTQAVLSPSTPCGCQ